MCMPVVMNGLGINKVEKLVGKCVCVCVCACVCVCVCACVRVIRKKNAVSMTYLHTESAFT